MLKGNKKYFFILAVCFTGLILLQILAPKPLNWNQTFMKKDKIPFGTSALFDALPGIFPGQEIQTQLFPIYNALSGAELHHCNYIILNNAFQPDELDTRELLQFAEKGNSVFIAANYFAGTFADSLKLKTDNYYELKETLKIDSAALSQFSVHYDTACINFVNPGLKRTRQYVYIKGIENTHFNSFDSTKTTVLGKNSAGKINFIELRWGKGKIFLSTVPEVFTNYLFVNKDNYDYPYKALSYLPNQKVIWDEHYKAGIMKNDSTLRVIFNNPALKSAYYLLLFSLIIFIILGVKRRQRIIPVIEPYRNTTLDFVGTVGTLYYQTGDHKNIADKKMLFFLEYIRSTFQIKTNMFDDAFIDRITNLSGIDRKKIHDLFYYFADISVRTSITQQELLKLNRMIEEFHRMNHR